MVVIMKGVMVSNELGCIVWWSMVMECGDRAVSI